MVGSYGNSIFLVLFEELPHCFPWRLHRLTFPPTVFQFLRIKGSCFFVEATVLNLLLI